MDNLTHGLVGYCLYKASALQEPFEIKAARVILAVSILASELPDVDMVSIFFGTDANLLWHRTYTHSILGLFGLSLILTAPVHALWPKISVRRVFIISVTAGVLHSFFDLLTSYGTKFLTPWSDIPYSWDILPIIDPYLLILLITFLWAGHKKKHKFVLLMIVLCMTGYIGMRTYIHSQVINQLRASIPHSETTVVMPTIGGLATWRYTAETPDGFKNGNIRWHGDITEDIFIPDISFSPVVQAAAQTNAFKILQSWARLVAYRVQKEEYGWHVLVFDPRYAFPGRLLFVAHVWIDDNYNIIRQDIASR